MRSSTPRLALLLTLCAPSIAQSIQSAPLASNSPTATAVPSPSASSFGVCPTQELLVSTSTGVIHRIDNYATTPTASLLVDSGVVGMTDIAIEPGTGRILGIVFLGSGSNIGIELVDIDRTTGVPTLVGLLPEFTNALDFAPDGRLFGTSDIGTTFEIDPNTAAATAMVFGATPPAGDLAWDVDGTLLLTTVTGDVERIDLQAQTATPLVNTGLGTTAYGIEVDCDGTVYVATDTSNWMTLDVQTGATTLIGNFGIGQVTFGVAFSEGPGPASLGTNYCAANPNSTGAPGVMSATGSLLVVSNDLELIATSLPLTSFGFFVTSQQQGFVPNPAGSQGNLCLGGAIGRFVGPGQIQNSGGNGEIRLVVDLAMVPTPNGLVAALPGETWNFQGWHRDVVGGQVGSNFTDGLMIQFL